MLNKPKLIALDLDDTTLRSDSTLAPETRLAIEAALKSGIEVVVASGRAFRSLPESVIGIPGIRYAITSNGAAIEQLPDGRRIMSLTLRETCVHEILKAFEGELLEAFVDGQPYCESVYMQSPVSFGCAPEYVQYVKTTRIAIDGMPRFMLENIDRLDSVDVLCRSPERKSELWERARKLSGVYVTSSSPRLIEIADKNAGKGAALKRLCETLGVAPENTLVFGNGDNDADMLRFAGLGVAVGNASPACIAAADLVCETNDALGVAKTIAKLLAKR